MRILLLTALVACSCVEAADRWIRVVSPNFDLYTPQGERKARQTILYFEQIRDFFSKAMSLTPDSKTRVRLVLFGSEQRFKPYRINEFAAAYYTQGIDRDYIIIGGYTPESERTAVHEYMHLLVRHSGLEIPIWMNEGLAELYSTLKPVASSVQIGHLIPSHFYQLRQSWIPLDRLLAVGYASPEYNRKAHAGVFYAESWALMHMLNLSTDYRPKFSAFRQEIVGGASGEEALQKAYGKPLSEIERDLSSYVKNNDRFYAAVFPVKFEQARFATETRESSQTEVNAVLASILVNARQTEAAKPLLEELERSYFPGTWHRGSAGLRLLAHKRFGESAQVFVGCRGTTVAVS